MSFRHAVRDVRTMKKLFGLAETEAARDGEDTFAAEHLLLAALELEDGTAAAALRATGHEADELRAALARRDVEALAAVGIDATGLPPVANPEPAGTGPLQSSATGQSVFQTARRLAGDAKQPILGAHVVLACAELERGTVPRALAAIGVDREDLAAAARAQLG